LVGDKFEIFGDLKFEMKGEMISLSDELVKRQFAVRSPEEFEKGALLPRRLETENN